MVKTYFAIILMALLLGACASSVRTDVTRFHELTLPAGETFIVIAKSEEKKGSIELQSYARLVSDRLRAEGFTPAGQATPDIVVKIDYSVSPPMTETRPNYRAPYYGGWGYGFGHRGFYGYGYPIYYYPYGYHHGFGSVFGYRHGYGGAFGSYYRSYSYTVYDRVFEMVIERNAGEKLFEGIANNIGRDKELVKIMPVLIEAMFREFPGQSGTTERYRIKLTDGGDY
ncbi:MAG: DUF4136 domain-containing protein [Sphingomonadales bacterium]